MSETKEIEIIEKSYELIKFEDGDFSLDVNVSPSEDTVWLTLEQISILFERDKSVISRHVKNIFKMGELEENSCVAFFATVLDKFDPRTGKIRKTNVDIKMFNLDIIISIGYRVNSKRGIIFRRWANSILKQYLLKGYVVNEARCMAHSDSLVQINNTINNINDRLSTLEIKYDNLTSIEIFKDRIIYDNQLFEGYSFIKNLFNKANNRIIIIDSYLDYSVLEMMNDINIDITIYIASHTPITNREIKLFKNNHNLNVIRTNKYHDRFIIIDDELYSIGSSIKDIGKRISQISKLESIDIDKLLNKYLD